MKSEASIIATNSFKPKNEMTEEERETSGGTLAVILLCVIIIWATGGWLVDSKDTVNRGTFGDMFGAVNALFSGLAFATLIYTVFLQRRELQLQREELAATRVELQRTAAAQEASELALKAQAEASEQSADLSAVNFLLNHYQSERATLQSNGRVPLYLKARYERLKTREEKLIEILDSVYSEVTTKHAKRHKIYPTIPTDHPPPEN